jgi:hypothetical protein
MAGPGGYPFADLALARRLERTEGVASSRSIEARASIAPERGACWIEVAGTLAMFDGPTSPLTQTFGLGMFEPVTETALDQIEAFFRDRGAPSFHEISPLAHESTVALLNARRYQPFEFTSLMYRSIADWSSPPPSNPAVRVRIIAPDESEVWARTAMAGWSDYASLGDFMLGMGRMNAATHGARSYLAELDGRPIATASLRIHDGVAFLAGAATIPSARRCGAQLALRDRRLRDGVDAGCDIAMMGAAPGSASQRNAERHGFRIAYTRVKWRAAP